MRSRKSIEGRLEALEEGSGPLIDDFADYVMWCAEGCPSNWRWDRSLKGRWKSWRRSCMKANVRKQKKNEMMQEAAKAKELPPEPDLEEQLRAAGFTKRANMEKKLKWLLSSEGIDAIERKYSRL